MSQDNVQGMLLGLACGDALGAPVEFMEHTTILEDFGGPLQDMVSGGWLNTTAGQVTDDTEMMLALAATLQRPQQYLPSEALQAYREWYDAGPTDCGQTIAYVLKHVRRDIERHQEQQQTPGDALLQPDDGLINPTSALPFSTVGLGASVDQLERARYWSHMFHLATQGKSAGNGSLMRGAPLSVTLSGQHLQKATFQDSHLTHWDPLAAQACVWFCEKLRSVLFGTPPPLTPPPLHDAVNADMDECLERTLQAPGFVLTSLAVAACAERSFNDAESGIVWAVNLGGDADTSGAITGALLGAKYGAKSLPTRWTDIVAARDVCLREGERLWQLTQQPLQKFNAVPAA